MSTRPQNHESSRIGVSEHAKLRYRQRCDGSETFVTDAVREMFADATRVRAPHIDGTAWDAGDFVLVTDDSVRLVITVLPAGAAE